MLNDISFREYKKSEDIHGTILYPAVMVAPMQKDIINKLILKSDLTSIFDPFHGSGTALYEAMEISPDLHLVGCDINPLANLITKVKLQGINSNIYEDIENLKKHILYPTNIEPFSFPNINKWFRSDIIESLAILRTAIMKVDDNQNRLYFWYMLCDVIRRHSNTRSSTYKLHIRTEDAIQRIDNRVYDNFLYAVEQNIDKFSHHSNNFILYKKDILKQLEVFEDKSFDISITSPPYGENATTVTYGQFSMLALYTIAKNDLELDGWELDNYSKIDSFSMGGYLSDEDLDDFEYNLIAPYLNRISIPKQKKVIRFFSDYFEFINGLCRVTNKYIVLTLGNRTVDRIQINLTEISIKYLEYLGFSNLDFAQREIPIKRTPKIISNVNQEPINSMNCEYVIIHERTV